MPIAKLILTYSSRYKLNISLMDKKYFPFKIHTGKMSILKEKDNITWD